MEKFYSINQAAALVGVTPRTIRHWIALGELKYIQIGRRIYLTEQHFKNLVGETTEVNINGNDIELEEK